MITNTPGVYIKEINTLPPSVAGVSTAVPAFIGFTEKNTGNPERISSMDDFEALFGMAYQPSFKFTINTTTSAVTDVIPDRRYFLYDTLKSYFLNGGGPCWILSAGEFSSHNTGITPSAIASSLTTQMDELALLNEVTVVTAPDLHMEYENGGALDDISSQYVSVCNYALNECGDLKNKFAILDYPTRNSSVADARAVSPSAGNLKFGATYYPWLVNAENHSFGIANLTTTITSTSVERTNYDTIQSDYNNLFALFGATPEKTVSEMMEKFRAFRDDLDTSNTKTNFSNPIKYVTNLIVNLDQFAPTDTTIIGFKNSLLANSALIREIKLFFRYRGIVSYDLLGGGVGTGWGALDATNGSAVPDTVWYYEAGDSYATDTFTEVETDASLLTTYTSYVAGNRLDAYDVLASGAEVDLSIIFSAVENLFKAVEYKLSQMEKALFAGDVIYTNVYNAIQTYMKQIPSQGAIAGIYCKTDRDRGVWKSPANIAVQGIERPMVEVSNSEQDGLNVDDSTGKSINVIRTFTGKGPIVWGARTLEGNSNEWRYIAVRRFFNFAEESIKRSLESFVFEPNNARTWVKIKAMITSFLAAQWRAGALVGVKLDDAFFVKIGEETTTPTEINDGYINIQIGMAVARPAEFIVIEFTHKANQ